MFAKGSELRWKDGKIMHPTEYWHSPTRRRIPKLLVTLRALEVGVLIYINEPWVVFEETDQESKNIPLDESMPLIFYKNRYYLLPQKVKRQDSFKWLQKKGNVLLFFFREGRYLIKSFQLP